MDFMSSINVAYLNCRGQTGFNIPKQLQIENFLQSHGIDILHLQECQIDDDTFIQCNFILSNYSVIQNNSHNQYGTASIVKNSFIPENILLHQSGRIIIFNIGDITFGNVYLPSGTDGPSRTSRENFCGETIPTLLINSKSNGMIGGDWKNIISK
jgi:exonuclease III